MRYRLNKLNIGRRGTDGFCLLITKKCLLFGKPIKVLLSRSILCFLQNVFLCKSEKINLRRYDNTDVIKQISAIGRVFTPLVIKANGDNGSTNVAQCK